MSGVDRTAYVAGFLFSPPLIGRCVLLIRKARPAWQAGKLNGIGGHIEPGETPINAMEREFYEEAGLTVLNWRPVAVLTGKQFIVHFFSAWADVEFFDSARAQTDEPLVRLNLSDMWKAPIIPNLRFLLPLALDTTGIAKPVMLEDLSP